MTAEEYEAFAKEMGEAIRGKCGLPEPAERTFTLSEALEIAKYFEERGMDIMSKPQWGEFSNTMDINTYFKEKFNINIHP